jgi:hypothetical protein
MFAPRDHDFPRRPDTIPRHNSRKARVAICAAGCLIQCFDRISANGLERLVTLWGEVIPRLRFEEGLCLFKAVPFSKRNQKKE